MEERGFDFLFSGEVLGQRPMSQNLSALQAVAKHSGYPDRILRPLSARLLPITPMEEQGLVDRTQLLDIQGRSRRRQEELARAWGLTDYPSSGGGCLLTEERFSDRLRDLLAHAPDATVADVELLKVGRHFRLSPAAKLILGRNQQENVLLEGLARPGDVLLKTVGFTGPLGLLCGAPAAADLERAAAVVAAYGKGQEEETVSVSLKKAGVERLLAVRPGDRSQSRDRLL
jgi:tRNA U34 2-thiouridine synthase MnmA/TrmU